MRISAHEIARALVDTVTSQKNVGIDQVCDSAIALLRKKNPGTTLREFFAIVEHEMHRRGIAASGMLVVPHEKSIKAESIGVLLSRHAGKTVHVERLVEPEIIGGAVVLVDHKRIDSSIQGALKSLLNLCLHPLE